MAAPKIILQALTTVLVIACVNSLCSFSCTWQYRSLYIAPGEGEKYEMSCKDSSRVLTYNGYGGKEIRECYADSGPFVVIRRPGNKYRCVKYVDSLDKERIVFYYENSYQYFKKQPSLCEVCDTGKYKLKYMHATDANLGILKYYKAPSMGCNRPKNCPMWNPYWDIPCNGCEIPFRDDGMCCKGCK